jgi:hypothetical protein
VARRQEVAQHFRIAHVTRIEHVANRKKLFERLRHLLVVDVDEAVVHPQLREPAPVAAQRLRDLVLVMRELQVHAAGVNVEVAPSSS